MTIFKDWLRETVDRLGLKQQTLAQQVGVSQATVSTWLNSDAERDRPRADSLIRLAEVTRVSPYFLFNMVYGLPMPDDKDERSEEMERIIQGAEQLSKAEQEQLIRYIDFVTEEGRRGKNAQKVTAEAGRSKPK